MHIYEGCGVQRLFFVFSDSLQVGGNLGPGYGEGMIQVDGAAKLGGIVCVAD